MEDIGITILRAFIEGIFIGIILALCKKIYLVIVGIALFLLMLGCILFGFSSMALDLNWGLLNWICMIIFVNLGVFIGISIIELIREELK